MENTVNLTLRQSQTIEWIKDFIRKQGMPPTVREIGKAFGIKSSSVFGLLTTLERKGCLRRGDRGARSLIVEGLSNVRDDVVEVPVIGSIAAGRPIEAIEDRRGLVAVSRDIFRNSEVFALKVKGDSMIDAGILNGDYVLVRKQGTAQNGDIVVALIGDEATLKRFHRTKDGVLLSPANPTMVPIFVQSGEFRIQGKVVGVQRFFD